MSTSPVGAYSAWNFTVSAEAKTVFAAATAGYMGVSYSPLAFATQVVAGTNYAFICSAIASTHPEVIYPAVVHIYAPLNGKPVITGITNLGPEINNLPGGYSNWNFPTPAADNALLAEALKSVVGVDYVSYGDTVQVVAGANYWFLCSGTVPQQDPITFAAMVQVNKPLDGAPKVTQIQRISPN